MNPKAAPFFNYRKRHRQAILSDPSQLSTNFTNPEQTQDGVKTNNIGDSSLSRKCVVRSGGLMDINGSFNNKQTFSSTSRATTQSSTAKPHVQTGWNSYGNSFNSKNQQDKGYNKTPISFTSEEKNKTQSKSLSAGYNDKQYVNSFNNDFFSNDSPNMWDKNKQQRLDRRQLSTPAPSNSAVVNCGAYQSSFNRNRGTGKPNNIHTARGGSSVPGYQQKTNTQSLPSTFGKQNSTIRNSCYSTTKLSDAQSHTVPSSSIFCDNLQKQSQTGKTTLKSKAKVKEVDSSMRIFTCTISDYQNWTTLRSTTCPVIFEIFGVVDSAVLMSRDRTGKEFLLSDETSKIKCIFYEIDRSIPKITRGKVHRVIGRIDSQNNKLIVISVRVAEQEEKQIWDMSTKASKKDMDLLYTEQ